MTRRRRARAFLSSLDRSCSLINSPSISINVGVARSPVIFVAYARGVPGLGIFGTRLQAANCSGTILSPEYMGGGGGGGGSLLFFSCMGGSLSSIGALEMFSAADDTTDADIVSPPTTNPFSFCAACWATSCPSRYDTRTLPLCSPDTSALTSPMFPYFRAKFRISSMLSLKQSSSSKSSSFSTLHKTNSPTLDSCCSCGKSLLLVLTTILDPPTTRPLSCCTALSAAPLFSYTMNTFPLSSPEVAARAPST
mmetsp:Transcript_22851/g.40986  ORF Transcript_22851/g.40986 Transcript_22851/m.40986 type:complete len:252 (-) Transcript_22851:2506-3261(-)